MKSPKWLMLIMLLFCLPCQSQEYAMKTNLLKGTALCFNMGLEKSLSNQWTAEISGSYNPWTLKHNRKWKHWMLQPELRYWPCQKFNGWFLAAYVQGGAFNIGHLPFPSLEDSRYEGWFIGGGVGLGHQWLLSRHLSVEAEAGWGYNYSRYNRYGCHVCAQKTEADRPYHYLGVSKLTLGFIYVF